MCKVYVSSVEIIRMCLCAAKKRAGSTLEILEVWGWAGWLARSGIGGGGGKASFFCFGSLSCCKTTYRGVADAQLGWVVLASQREFSCPILCGWSWLQTAPAAVSAWGDPLGLIHKY